MRVLVLGAGVVGMATAYYLWRNGHEVEVIDRQAGPGLETSFGNAGGICPSFAGPWAAPGMISKVLRLSLQRNSPIRFSLGLDRRKLSWIRQWLHNCQADKFRVNKLRMQRVAHYSYKCLKDVVADTGIKNFDFQDAGVLQVFQTPAELELGRISAQALEEHGVPWRLLSNADINHIEPALANSAIQFAGGLHLPADASGDSYKFVNELAVFLQSKGVRFRYGASVHALDVQGDQICGVATSQGAITADSYAVALGSYAPLLVAPLGMKLPVYPLKGYSITVPITDKSAIAKMALMDEHNKVMMSCLGNRLRLAGMAELTGYDLTLNEARKKLLIRVATEFFPSGLDLDHVDFWAGLRPMTPDGPPILGRTPWKNLFLNSGQGSNGWTQACGTGKIVADLISGLPSDIDMEGLTIERFHR
ncbi:MAG TPA: D-amino acid dehydrogenase [Eoetvoesiella sp.]